MAIELETDRASFVRAICEQPDDNVCRLAFADFLDEGGECARAEFIRLQCRRADDTDTGASKRQVRNRLRKLTRGNCEYGHAAGIRDVIPGWRFHATDDPFMLIFADGSHTGDMGLAGTRINRGFVSHIRMTCAAFILHAEFMFANSPITSVRLTDKVNRTSESWPLNRFGFMCDAGNPTLMKLGDTIPVELWAIVSGLNRHPRLFETTWLLFDTAEEADATLSRACVQYGRSLVGLLPLPA